MRPLAGDGRPVAGTASTALDAEVASGAIAPPPGKSHRYLPTANTTRRCRTPVPETVDVAIIGAGTAGLVAGAYLSRQGFRVALFDPHYVAGGCATQFARGPKDDPYVFDIGLHYIGDCGPEGLFQEILGPLDLNLDFVPLDPNGFDELIFPDFRFRIPADLDLFRQRLLELFPRERRGIDKYLRLLRHVNAVPAERYRRGGSFTLPFLWRVLLQHFPVARNDRRTISEFLDSCTRDPHLRAVLLGQSGDYGLRPSVASAIIHTGVSGHYFRGAYYPRGGGQAISDQLADSIEAHGGTIHLGRGIERVVVKDGRAVGVRTQARRGAAHEVGAKVVLSNADIKKTIAELVGPEHLPARLIKRSNAWTMPVGLFMTFLGVRTDMRAKGMRRANYWTFDGYDMDAYYDIDLQSKDRICKGVYITSATLKDHDVLHAPAGVTNLEVMTFADGRPETWGLTVEELRDGRYRRNPVYVERKQALEDEMVERLEELFPGTAETIVFKESSTPITHGRYTGASGGTGYGIAATPTQWSTRRPDVRSPLAGLYFCGASTQSGHGVIGAVQSGATAAQKIASELGRPIELDR